METSIVISCIILILIIVLSIKEIDTTTIMVSTHDDASTVKTRLLINLNLEITFSNNSKNK